MTGFELRSLAYRLSSIGVFRGVLEFNTMKSLVEFLDGDCTPRERMNHFGGFVKSLEDYNCSFSDFLKKAVFEDENAYVKRTASGSPVPESLRRNALAELELFSELTRLSACELCGDVIGADYVPVFESEPVDFVAEYSKRLENIGKFGYGIFAGAGMFRVERGDIIPIAAADTVSAADFVGYESERAKIFDNTRILAEGGHAANALLFGDAGTGKSSTVKACANHFFGDGVRLIELRKDQLFDLPEVMGKIAGNPLKFIIFIDDLSFNKNDDSFSMLKAALEGSASAKAENAVIYATSNRRHIVKESFSDRSSGDDVHRGDTVQEIMSLSDRFGLTVYFPKPDKALYITIVKKLAEKYGVAADDDLSVKAEAFALAKGSRSPRAACQFINSLRQKGMANV